MKKLVSLFVTAIMLLTLLPLTHLYGNAVTYQNISLNIPWFCQRVSSDCGIASVSMIEGYYVGCNDNDTNVYNAVYNYNGGLSLNYSKLGYTQITTDLETIYRQLKNNKPILVYRKVGNSPHFSVIYGYNGSTTALHSSGFQMRFTYGIGYNSATNKYDIVSAGNMSWTNLESYLKDASYYHMYVRTSSKIPINNSGNVNPVTIIGYTESLKCPFTVLLPMNTPAEFYASENKTNYMGIIESTNNLTFTSNWEIYLSDGSVEYYVQYNGKYGYLIAPDGVSGKIYHASKKWVTTKEPTCTEYGEKTEYCTNCDAKTNTKQLDKLEHVPEEEWDYTYGPTCTSSGFIHKFCKYCNERVESEFLLRKGHSFPEGVWYVIVEPTSTTVGTKVRFCDVCGFEEYESIPATGNDTENLLFGKPYSISGNGLPAEFYTADLTDGIASDDVTVQNSWFGFNSGNIVNGIGSVTFDLGDCYQLNSLRIHYGCNWDWGVCEPKRIAVFTSNDGVNFTERTDFSNLRVCYQGDAFSDWAEIIDVQGVKGRFLRIAVEVNGSWAWINEIEATGSASNSYSSIKGDINNNEIIDSMDYVLLKRAYFGTYKLADIAVGDINNNGSIDSMDYVYLRRAYFGTYVIK